MQGGKWLLYTVWSCVVVREKWTLLYNLLDKPYWWPLCFFFMQRSPECVCENKSEQMKTFPTFLTTQVEELSIQLIRVLHTCTQNKNCCHMGHAEKKVTVQKKTDKQCWCASLFLKHKVTLVCFFKVTVSERVTGLIKGYCLCVAIREPEHRDKNKPLWASALGKCWLKIRQRVPSILALSHWQYHGVNRGWFGLMVIVTFFAGSH